MDAQTTRSTAHPMMIIAAISVTLLSAAGIAAIMGWIPNSNSQQAAAPLVAEAPKAPAAVEPVKSAEPAKVVEAPKPAPVAAAKPKHVAKPDTHVEHKTIVSNESRNEPRAVEYAPPVQVAQAPVRQICYDCGVIDSVRAIEKAGEGSGLGAVAGGVAGAVLGHQVGGGRGKDVMTVLGAVGGGLAGHQIEKTVKKTKTYDITVRFEDGTTRVFNQPTEPAWRAGDKVRVNNGIISSNS
jgi:outer membrane lipoprotein SlyB